MSDTTTYDGETPPEGGNSTGPSISTVYSTSQVEVEKTTEYSTDVPAEQVSTQWETSRNTVDVPAGAVSTSRSTSKQNGLLKLETQNSSRDFLLPYQSSVGPRLESWPIGESRYLLPYEGGGQSAVREGDREIFIYDLPSNVTPALVRRDSENLYYLQLTGTYPGNLGGMLQVAELDGGRYISLTATYDENNVKHQIDSYPLFPIWNWLPSLDQTFDEKFGEGNGLRWAWRTSNVITSWLTETDATYRTTRFNTDHLTASGPVGTRTTSHDTLYFSEVINTLFLTEDTDVPVEPPTTSAGDLSTVYKSTSALTDYPAEYASTEYTVPLSTDHVTTLSTSFTTTTPVGPNSQYVYVEIGGGGLNPEAYLRAGATTPVVGDVFYLFPTSLGVVLSNLPDGSVAAPIAVELTANGWVIQSKGRILPAEQESTVTLYLPDGAGGYTIVDADPMSVGSAVGAADDLYDLAWALHDSETTPVNTSYSTTVQLITDHLTSRDTEIVPAQSKNTEWTTHFLVEEQSASTSYETRWTTDGVFITGRETQLGADDVESRTTSLVTDYNTTYQSGQATFHQTVKVTEGSTELSTVKMMPTQILTEKMTDIIEQKTGQYKYTFYTKFQTIASGGRFTRLYNSAGSPYTNTLFDITRMTQRQTEKWKYTTYNTKVGERATDHYTGWNTGKEAPTHVATNKETIYDTHYQTFSERSESGQRVTEWTTTPQAGEVVQTNWETQGDKITSRTTSFTGRVEVPTNGSGLEQTSVTTEYLTGENSTRYDTHYGTVETVRDTLQRNTSQTTEFNTSTLLTASTAVIDLVEVDTSHLTAVDTTVGGVQTWAVKTTTYQTQMENTLFRSTVKPREVLTEHVTEWITDHITERQIAHLTSHETVAGTGLFYTSHSTLKDVPAYTPDHLSAQVPQSQVPPLDVIGPFTFTGPFAQYNGQLLKCLSVEDMGLLAKRGVDIQGEYYQPYNLTMDAYLADFDAGAKLVTLASVDEHVEVVVPSTYIESMPSGSYVPYSRLILTVDLGLLPDELDLNAAQAEVAAILLQTLGRTPEVDIVRMAMEGGVTREQHTIMETNRLHEIQATPSDKAQIERLERRLAEEVGRNAQLEEILLQVATP